MNRLSLQQVTLVIPPEIEVGLLAGKFMRKGSIVRNLAGEIVKHLDEAPIPNQEIGRISLRIPKVLKNPKTVGIGLGIGMLIIGGAYLIHRSLTTKSKRDSLADVASYDAFEKFSSALNDYLTEAQEGALSLRSIDRLIEAINMLCDMQGGASTIVGIPAEKLTLLASIIYEYTARLASANATDFTMSEPAKSMGLHSITNMLLFQRSVFNQAA